MTEPSDAVLMIRTVTVSDMMNAEGIRFLTVQSDGEPELWEMLGMLDAAILSVRADMESTWIIGHGGDEDADQV